MIAFFSISAPTNSQPIFNGGILILAVGLSTLARQYAARA
jgi:hypothetical protein